MKEFNIGRNEAGQRFDKYLMKLLKNAGTGLIFKQLREKNITLNKAKAKGNEILELDDKVQIFMADSTIEKFMSCQGVTDIRDTLKVIYEDKDIIIADKPAGVLSQKASASDISMNELLIAHLMAKGMTENNMSAFRPAFCNRLDRNTSGIMLGGTSLVGLRKLSGLIKDRTIDKYYLAAAEGIIDRKIHKTGFLLKDERTNRVTVRTEQFAGAAFIDTEYIPLAVRKDIGMTLLSVKLITGKSHQIRAQLASMGHPVIGDNKYGHPSVNRKYNVRTQLLHAYRVRFPHMDGELSHLSEREFHTEFPGAFMRFFDECNAMEVTDG